MSSNPTWTSSVVHAEDKSKSPNYTFVDSSAGKFQSSEVQPWPDLFPCPENPEDTDPLCLHQACQGVLDYLYSDIKIFAEQYAVPEELLIAMVTDWVVSKKMGLEPLPASSFIPE